MSKKNKIDLGSSPVGKTFWRYAIPSILAMTAQSAAGMINSIFIGRTVGPEGLTAITLLMPIVMFLIGLATMVAIGGTTRAGIELGKGNPVKSNNMFNVTLSSLAILGLLSTAIVNLLLTRIADLAGATGEARLYLLQYGRTLSPFILFFLLNFSFIFFLKLDGRPIIAVSIAVFGTILNILLGYILIVMLGMKVKGAALATGISQLIPFLMLSTAILIKSRWTIRRPVFRRKDIFNILFNGSSELLSNSAYSISGFLFNIIIMKRIGVTGVAAYAVSLQMAALANAIGYGFAESNQTGISYNYGAGKLVRVRSFLRYTLSASLAAGIIIFFITFFLGEKISLIFIKDPATLKLAGHILKFYAFAFLVSGWNISLGTYYTAIGDPRLSGLLTLYRALLSLMIGLLLFPTIFGDNGIWMALLFAEGTSLILGIIIHRWKPFGLDFKEIKEKGKIRKTA
ncbi:MAG: hypothetical protein JEZ04_14180 [Spirochaetales bacterium]|nr:hypothetical protein [Spirochaetales bacterium]